MKKAGIFAALSLLLGITSMALSGIDPTDTRLMEQPAISQDHIAFIYANDLWVARLDGSQPRRLTISEGTESRPHFSPDGKHIAFSGEYDGNTDVFLLPVEGGIPERLTWHPMADQVAGFTPDGSKVLFLSMRNVHTGRFLQLFTVPLEGGFPEKLVIPNAYHASYSPDGSSMVYTPIGDRFRQWKNYRGGTMSTLWIFSFEDHSKTEIPRSEGGCNDINPMWIGDLIYFLSDRNGEFNLFSYHTGTKEVKQLTQYEDFPIISASHHKEQIIYEQEGYLHTFDTGNARSEKLTIGIATDLLELRPRYVKGDRYIRSAHVSPSGARAVFDFRGEIFTLPADKGDPRNLTLTSSAHEKYPAWSPDGKEVAYFSDATGEYALHIKPQDGRGEARVLPLTGTGFYSDIHWSPDSKKLSYVDNGRNFYLMDLASGAVTKINSDALYRPGPFRPAHGDWSADSRWIAYTRLTRTNFEQVLLYSVEQNKSFEVSDGLSNAVEPVFDRGGKYLYFLASTDAGPVVNWFDQSSADMEMTSHIYLATLQKETLSPFAKESDEEEAGEEKAEKKEEAEENKPGKKKKEAEEEEPEKEVKKVEIDLEGIQNRIIDLPVDGGDLSGLGSARENQLIYLVRSEGKRSMHLYDLEKREDKEVAEIDSYVLSADGKKMLYRKASKWGIADAGAKPDPEKGNLNTAAIEVKIDPLSEWPQIFDEVWRINRDYFYDPGMHGADWPAMKEKYAPFLEHLSCRNDLNKVMMWMCSEVGVGHHRLGGGDMLGASEGVKGGLLGADFAVENKRYRIVKVFEGLNWNPRLRSPLTEPGLNVKAGEYLIRVNGKELTAATNLYQPFENSAGKIVYLTVGPNPDGSGSREIQVVPVESEYALRNRDWVEGNLRKVHEATGGQVAYVYVPNTAGAGHEYFKRYFFPQADKKAIIIDERYNGGGSLADYYIDILMRPYQAHWNMRYTNDFKSPSASIQGPKVMIIDENAGSGGDMLPWMFRKFNVGTLVGKTTWGGLVGVLGFPELVDGGFVTAPNVAIWTEDGFIVENVGVAPDIEVEQTPAEVIAGGDPQLDKAIEVALEQLRKNPPREPVRPPYPVRVRK
ncbi:MAG: PDZ domain-containing protein [Bacteroidales bacterium]|nr:PDZ domain-containing protein [Bacteroidales bacterium]